mgnify:FL=1|jgi:hypothetical protein
MAKEIVPDEMEDLMPTDGGIFQPEQPIEIVEEVNEEKNMIQTSRPILKELFAWLDEEIKATSNIDSIDINGNIEVEVLSQRKLKDKLIGIKNRFEQLDERFNK